MAGSSIADRVRMINRLRDLMPSVFPALEREFDYKSGTGAVVLLTGYASPDRIRDSVKHVCRRGCNTAECATTPVSPSEPSPRLEPS